MTLFLSLVFTFFYSAENELLINTLFFQRLIVGKSCFWVGWVFLVTTTLLGWYSLTLTVMCVTLSTSQYQLFTVPAQWLLDRNFRRWRTGITSVVVLCYGSTRTVIEPCCVLDASLRIWWECRVTVSFFSVSGGTINQPAYQGLFFVFWWSVECNSETGFPWRQYFGRNSAGIKKNGL